MVVVHQSLHHSLSCPPDRETGQPLPFTVKTNISTGERKRRARYLSLPTTQTFGKKQEYFHLHEYSFPYFLKHRIYSQVFAQQHANHATLTRPASRGQGGGVCSTPLAMRVGAELPSTCAPSDSVWVLRNCNSWCLPSLPPLLFHAGFREKWEEALRCILWNIRLQLILTVIFPVAQVPPH